MKKFLAVLLLAILAFSFAGEALACNLPGRELAGRELERKVAVANAQINQYVAIAKQTPWDDVDWLLCMVDLTVQPVFAYARLIGATVACEYTQEYIDGRYVLIDPLYVVNLGDGKGKTN